VTGNKDLLINPRPLDQDITITFGNSGEGKAAAVGDVVLQETPEKKLFLRDVLYVPAAHKAHADCPADPWNVPGEHGVHAV
jgi:hypothetical protein